MENGNSFCTKTGRIGGVFLIAAYGHFSRIEENGSTNFETGIRRISTFTCLLCLIHKLLDFYRKFRSVFKNLQLDLYFLLFQGLFLIFVVSIAEIEGKAKAEGAVQWSNGLAHSEEIGKINID